MTRAFSKARKMRNKKIIYSCCVVLLALAQMSYVTASDAMAANVPASSTSVNNAAAPNAALEKRIDEILARMSREEKIGQMSLRDWGMYQQDDMAAIKQLVREGKVGGFLNVAFSSVDKQAFGELQRIAVEQSPNKIPLLFGQDVIHGYKTIFPIPLGQAASWNLELVKKGARIAAQEASADGIRWTFAPMIDISRDPRWGRIAETLGEDPHLASVLGVAMTQGFQTDDPTQPTALAASGKHFAGYGAAEGGRDYNAGYISEGLLRDVYLRPFKASVDAGMMTLMSSYSTLNDVPATGSKFLMQQILRDEWKFDGFVVSDWNAVLEMISHGFARDEKHAAELAANAGIDFEMYTDSYEKHLPALIREGKFSEVQLDTAVRNMLRIKLRLGLWDNPYPRGGQEKVFLNEAFLQAARTSARESFVLLKNDKQHLPLNKKQTVAVIGPLADAPHEQLGTWIYDGDKKDSRTFLPAVQQYLGTNKVIYAQGLTHSRDNSTKGFAAALAAAKKADVIVYLGGEESILSGEGHSRGDIRLLGAQQQLIAELAATGKPLVQVIMAGRPIQLNQTLAQSDALLMAWHPGTMAGPALVDVLFGEVSPSGRLPLTWPVAVGQIPIYYNHMNTGRPATDSNYTRIEKIGVGAFQHQPGNSSNLLDYGHKPQFPFGYGLTYSNFSYDKLHLSATEITLGSSLTASAVIKNTGKVAATEVVQLYVQDVVGDVARPVRELKNFERVHLQPGEAKMVIFKLHTEELAFHNQAMQLVTESGEFNVWIAPDAASGLKAAFRVK